MRWPFSAVAAGAIGFAAWQGVTWLIPMSASLPVLAFSESERKHAFVVTLAYYAVANIPVITATRSYFDPHPPSAVIALYWIAPSLFQTIPWTLCWTGESARLWYRVPLAFVLSVIPPLGIIGWASPLTAAGVLFPGWSWFGIALLIALSVFGCTRRVQALALTIALAIVVNMASGEDPSPPDSWEGVRTEFDRMTDPSGPLPEFRASDGVQRIAIASSKRTIVFPEFVVAKWTEATDAFWQPTIEHAKGAGATLLIGAGLPIAGEGRIENAIIVTGSSASMPFTQRIPIPMVIWSPRGGDDSIPIHLFGRGTVEVIGERAAILICYEQLLSWPILTSALERPTIIVGISNDHWVKNTRIPAVKEASVTAWARLFGLPKIIATNQ